MASNPKQLYTPEEYLAMERKAKYKSEYLDGEIFAMSGASEAHVLIEANIIADLHFQLRGTPCRVYTSNMRVDLSKHGMFAYPDALVVCGEAQFSDQHKDNLINPVLIVEVLSPSTEGYDRGEKFLRYRKRKTLKEYLLVSQHRPHVEHYLRQENNRWIMSEYDDVETSLELPTLEITLELSNLYAQVKFNS